MNVRAWGKVLCGGLAAVLLTAAVGYSQQAGDVESRRKAIVQRGLNWLREQGQAADGTFTAKAGPGLTALALTAALRNGVGLDDPMVSKGLKALEGFVKPDGGIYGSGRLRNYETCVAMVAFAEANKTGQYTELLKRARAFVTGMQVEGTKDPSEPWYGGAGYAGAGRPDLSNTAYLIEALRSADATADDPAIQRALMFVSRCQNLDSKFNDTKFAKLVNDGGFYYAIPTEKLDPSTSPDRVTENGGLRSYGSMTYSGLKSMIYAGLTAKDPRVKAAVEWITKHYAVDQNPGMGAAGLYYYYHTFAAALSVAGVDQVKGEDGQLHDWRADLVAELGRRQAPDGSWANDDPRWFENDRNLSTSFALMALAYCVPPTAVDAP